LHATNKMAVIAVINNTFLIRFNLNINNGFG